MPTAIREILVINEAGLHFQPVVMFVDVANQFSAEIEVTKRGTDGEPDETVDGKSIMAMGTIVGVMGTKYELRGKGDDAEQALAALAELFERKFDEEK